jgi:hypothetical protein
VPTAAVAVDVSGDRFTEFPREIELHCEVTVMYPAH